MEEIAADRALWRGASRKQNRVSRRELRSANPVTSSTAPILAGVLPECTTITICAMSSGLVHRSTRRMIGGDHHRHRNQPRRSQRPDVRPSPTPSRGGAVSHPQEVAHGTRSLLPRDLRGWLPVRRNGSGPRSTNSAEGEALGPARTTKTDGMVRILGVI